MTAPALTQAEASAGVWWRSLIPLGLVTVLVGLTGAFLMPFLPVFLSQQVNASPLQASVFLFLSPVAAIVVSNVVGWISDRPGARQRVIFVAATSGAVGFGLYAVVRQYWILLAVSLTLLAAATAIVPQIYALGREVVLREEPSRVTLGTNTLRMMMSLAWAAGAPLGALILSAIDFDGLFLATALMYLVILGIVALLRDTLFRPRQPDQPVPPADGLPTAAGEVAPLAVDSTPVPTPEATGGPAPSRSMIVAVSVAFVTLQAVTVLTVTAMPLFISVDLRGTLANAGAILGLCAAIEIPLMLAFGVMAARWSLYRLLLVGGACGAAYCLAVSLATSVWQVAAAQVLHASFVCCIGGLGITYFQELMPSALGRATTLFTNTGRLAGMLSGLAFGLVQVHGYRLAYVGSLGLALTGTAVLAAIAYRRRRRGSPAGAGRTVATVPS
ncbi:MAG: sugar efflux transporter [Micromonosporaceae bacterium]|nr:sugar efflux transporter [Micromonosporaceae bacterium]